jgi:hypothetical protein
MCGIYGFQLKPGKKPDSKVQRLALLLGSMNDNRGGHSWGWHSPGAGTHKGLGLVSPHAMKAGNFTQVLAHTRFATTGEKTIPNAHPFKFGNIIGAHNGVISNHSDLNKEFDRKFEVDSMHIFAHLNEGKDFKDLRGYGAIEWVNKKMPGEIFLCRLNSQGSLAVAQTREGVVWSSDKDHLEISLAGSGLHFENFYEVSPESVYSCQDGVLYKTESKLELGMSISYSKPYGNVTDYRSWRDGWYDGDTIDMDDGRVSSLVDNSKDESKLTVKSLFDSSDEPTNPGEGSGSSGTASFEPELTGVCDYCGGNEFDYMCDNMVSPMCNGSERLGFNPEEMEMWMERHEELADARKK